MILIKLYLMHNFETIILTQSLEVSEQTVHMFILGDCFFSEK